MLLKTIKIKNFFCFINEEITLEEGFNIICADNNFGKSSIFGAIKWCLKGGEIFKENSTYTKSETFNEISLLKNESEMSVEIEFEHENSNFYLSRKSKIKSSAKRETLQDTDFDDQVSLFKDGDGIPQNLINDEIEKVLPDYSIKMFFFDGEDMDDIADNILNIEGQEKKLLIKLQDAIGIPYYEHICSISDKLTTHYKKQKTNLQKKTGYKSLTLESLEKTQSEIDEKKKNHGNKNNSGVRCKN